MGGKHNSCVTSAEPGAQASRLSWINRGKVSLICLVLQNLSLIHFLKESKAEGHPPYSAAAAVLVGEIIKLAICAIALLWKHHIRIAVREVMNRTDLMYLTVPAAMYTMQNILIYYSFTALDAVSFQILYQFKIFTLAFFLWIFMHRTLRPLQIASLFLLMAGIILVQAVNGTDKSVPVMSANGGPSELIAGLCVVLAAVSSGFAGVYTEMILKGKVGSTETRSDVAIVRVGRPGLVTPASPHPPPSSLFVKNAQMSVLGVIFGTAAWLRADGVGALLHPTDLLFGWTGTVWMAVMTGAVGGLVVAAVMKYADNMLKTFATSISIVVSTYASIVAGSIAPDFRVITGIAMVVLASVLYTWNSFGPSTDATLPFHEKTSGKCQALEMPLQRIVIRSYKGFP